MHFTEQGKPRLGASTVLHPCAAVSILALLLHECTACWELSSLPADRWSSGSDQKDVGLLTNAVLMVPCVVGRGRHAAANTNTSDPQEGYIMVFFGGGRLFKSD